jgi:hypothetical protein
MRYHNYRDVDYGAVPVMEACFHFGWWLDGSEDTFRHCSDFDLHTVSIELANFVERWVKEIVGVKRRYGKNREK